MTSVVHRSQTAAPAEPSRQSRRVRIGLMVDGIQVGVAVDGLVPIARQIQAIVDLANTRLGEVGAPRLQPSGSRDATQADSAPVRGRWALCWVDGRPLRPNRSLSDQGVAEGAQLWLRFVDDTEARTPVIEHVTSAMPAQLRTRWQDIAPAYAARVGAVMVAAAVAVVSALLVRWRYGHHDWLAPSTAGAVALVVLTAAAVLGIRSARHRRADAREPSGDRDAADELAAELFLADLLLLVGAGTAAVAAALAVPGPLGAPHAAMAAAVAGAAAALAIRFTGRHIGLCAAAMVVAAAALVTAVARMLLLTSAVTLLTVMLLAAVVGIKIAPTLARQAARIRLPVFPSAGGRWVWETRPDLPTAVVVAGGADPQLEGPESVRDVVVATDRVHGYLSGLLAGLCTLLLLSAVGLCDPHTHQRWLPLLLAGVTAGWAVLHARSYTDRWQATALAVTGAVIVAAVCARYAVGLWTAPAMLVGCAVTVAVPAAGLVAATVVPKNFYTPVVKQIVEWTEYALLVAMWPLGFWLMDVFAAIRYR
jgi:type VII secretion integral membrane protein EccD